MAKSSDWMPGPRTEILAMCQNWLLYVTEDRQTACVCCRCENQKGQVGQWGPVVSAIIP
jgi:hypothetical protein